MADSIRQQKLAAAKKLLKKHQQEKHKVKSENDIPDNISTASSENIQPPIENNLKNEPTENLIQNVSPVPNYFTSSANAFVAQENEHVVYNNVDYSCPDNIPVVSNDSAIMPDYITFEDPELKGNEIYNIAHNQSQPLLQSVSQSPMESIRQMTSELNKYIAGNVPTENIVTRNGLYEQQPAETYQQNDFEKRNAELVTLYERGRSEIAALKSSEFEYKNRIEELEKELQSVQGQCDQKIGTELGPLQEQLQYNMQMVNILVSEKTELSEHLRHLQIELSQRNGELDGAKNRIKSFQDKLQEMERELRLLHNEKNRYDQMGTEHTEVQNKLQCEMQSLCDSYEEAKLDLTEVREKLRKSEEDNVILRSNVNSLTGQLDLCNVKIQQLTITGTDQVEEQITKLTQENKELTKKLEDLNVLLKQSVTEKDQASDQYQQYVQQLNNNMSKLAEKLDITTRENENLLHRENEFIRHIGELEKHLQTLQNEHINLANATRNGDTKKELISTQSELEATKINYDSLNEKYETLIQERDDLLKELDRKKQDIVDLKENLERLKDNQADNSKLLATIESDKIAASRAVQQNIELKQQLEEMQDAFIKMTNDKAELANMLTSEQHIHKELIDKFHATERHLATVATDVTLKDREMIELREKLMQQDQLMDRLRHYETFENSSQSLRIELERAIKEVEFLREENKLLRQSEAKPIHDSSHQHHHDHPHEEGEDCQENEHKHAHQLHTNSNPTNFTENDLQIELFNLRQKVDILESVNRQLHDDLLRSLSEEDAKRRQSDSSQENTDKIYDRDNEIDHEHFLQTSPYNCEHPNHHDMNGGHTDPNIELNDKNEHSCTEHDQDSINLMYQNRKQLNRESAIRQLETKFMKTMQDIANLQDEKQKLEHLVLQLQGETETIGEYVTLYQYQRGVLRQRTLERERQLKQLSTDRYQMKIKLNQLNNLVRRLIGEKSPKIASEIIKQQKLMNKSWTETLNNQKNSSKDTGVNNKNQDISELNSGSEKESFIKSVQENGNDLNSSDVTTAEEIIALVSEIKACNLVQPGVEISESFKPCPWCSGQLLTV